MEALMSIEDLAAVTGAPVASVYQWNHKRTGPRFLKVGRHVRYRPADVEAWLKSREHGNTAA